MCTHATICKDISNKDSQVICFQLVKFFTLFQLVCDYDFDPDNHMLTGVKFADEGKMKQKKEHN